MTYQASRRDVLKPLAAGGLVAGLPGAVAADGKRPDIVVVMVDDMGFSDIGCYGGEIEMPNLDSLAANGVRFTQFYNTARCWLRRHSSVPVPVQPSALEPARNLA